MLLIKKNGIIVGIEFNYQIKKLFDNFELFFNFLIDINKKINNKIIDFNCIKTNKLNISIYEINDDKIFNLIEKYNNNSNFNKKSSFDFDFNIDNSIKTKNPEKIEVGVEKVLDKSFW